MDHFVELDTVAVVSITLVALTSILAALRGGDLYEWAPRLYAVRAYETELGF